MKEHVVTTPKLGHLSTRSSMQDTTSQLSKPMPRHMSRSAINVYDSAMSLDSRQITLPQWWPLGLLHIRDWMFWALFQLDLDKLSFSGGNILFH